MALFPINLTSRQRILYGERPQNRNPYLCILNPFLDKSRVGSFINLQEIRSNTWPEINDPKAQTLQKNQWKTIQK